MHLDVREEQHRRRIAELFGVEGDRVVLEVGAVRVEVDRVQRALQDGLERRDEDGASVGLGEVVRLLLKPRDDEGAQLLGDVRRLSGSVVRIRRMLDDEAL